MTRYKMLAVAAVFAIGLSSSLMVGSGFAQDSRPELEMQIDKQLNGGGIIFQVGTENGGGVFFQMDPRNTGTIIFNNPAGSTLPILRTIAPSDGAIIILNASGVGSTGGPVGHVLLSNDNAASTLNGTAWSLREFQILDSVEPIISGTRVTVVFSEDGVNGSGGCNVYGAKAEYGKGDNGQIKITELYSTTMHCADPPGVSAQESRFFEFMLAAQQFQFDGKMLRITDGTPADERALIFERQKFEAR